MAKPVSTRFFSANPVFDRAEYATAVGREPRDNIVTVMLAQHLRAGNIKRIARGVFASVPKHADAKKWSVNRFLAASRLRRNGIIAYHSALELHGRAYTEGGEVQVISRGESGVVEASGLACRFVKPPRGLGRESAETSSALTVVDRMGLDIRATTIERTIADLFDRYDLAGGPEELFNSLSLFVRLNTESVVTHMRTLRNASAAGALGYWLERERESLRVSKDTIEELHALAPKQARYALGTRPGYGRMVTNWNVILPVDIVDQRFEGI